MDIIEILGIIGAIASIIGLVLYFLKKRRNNILQNKSSIIQGNNNKAEIQSDSDIGDGNLNANDSTIIQKNSSIIYGSKNLVSIKVNEKVEFEPLINITYNYRHLKEFSISSFGGVFEIQELFVEVIEFVKCVPAPVMIEGLMFRTYYHIYLDFEYKYYPLLPPTLNDRQDGWVLKGDDIELFGIDFSWPRMTSVELVIKAKLFNHKTRKIKYIKSNNVFLSRNGERETAYKFQPKSKVLQFSPYLQKLLTIPDLLNKVNSNERGLNIRTIKEIERINKKTTVYSKQLTRIKEKLKNVI